MFPLSVQAKSDSAERANAANRLLNRMRVSNASLVDAALLVSKELIRCAIPWHEMWHEGLEESWRLYVNNNDIDGMSKILQPLHQMISKCWNK